MFVWHGSNNVRQQGSRTCTSSFYSLKGHLCRRVIVVVKNYLAVVQIQEFIVIFSCSGPHSGFVDIITHLDNISTLKEVGQ